MLCVSERIRRLCMDIAIFGTDVIKYGVGEMGVSECCIRLQEFQVLRSTLQEAMEDGATIIHDRGKHLHWLENDLVQIGNRSAQLDIKTGLA